MSSVLYSNVLSNITSQIRGAFESDASRGGDSKRAILKQKRGCSKFFDESVEKY